LSDTGDEYLKSATEPEDETRSDHPNFALGQTWDTPAETPQTFAHPLYVEVELPPVDTVIAEVEQNPSENTT
jgi:hypothetical protein